MTDNSKSIVPGPHLVLGLTPSATDEEIRDAFRKHAKENHPDLNPGDEAAEKRFKEISEAYAALSDAAARKQDLIDSSLLVDIDRPAPVDAPSSGDFNTTAIAMAGILALGTAYLVFSFWLYDNQPPTTAEKTIRLSYEANVSSSSQAAPPQKPTEHMQEPAAEETTTKQAEPKKTASLEENTEAEAETGSQLVEVPGQTEDPSSQDSETQVVTIEPIPLPDRNPFRSQQDNNHQPQLAARQDAPKSYVEDIPERYRSDLDQDELSPPSSREPDLAPPSRNRTWNQSQPPRSRAGYRRWILSRGQLCWIKWNGGLKCGEQLTNLSEARRRFILAKIREAQSDTADSRDTAPRGRPDHWQDHKPDQLNDETWRNDSGQDCWINQRGYKVCSNSY